MHATYRTHTTTTAFFYLNIYVYIWKLKLNKVVNENDDDNDEEWMNGWIKTKFKARIRRKTFVYVIKYELHAIKFGFFDNNKKQQKQRTNVLFAKYKHCVMKWEYCDVIVNKTSLLSIYKF